MTIPIARISQVRRMHDYDDTYRTTEAYFGEPHQHGDIELVAVRQSEEND